MKGRYLITTDAWFVAPDGRQYKSVWGEVEILDDNVLGVKTNRMSSNWFAKVGSENNHVIIAGCQIHYSCRCENKPNTDNAKDYSAEAGKVHEYDRPSWIYIAEDDQVSIKKHQPIVMSSTPIGDNTLYKMFQEAKPKLITEDYNEKMRSIIDAMELNVKNFVGLLEELNNMEHSVRIPKVHWTESPLKMEQQEFQDMFLNNPPPIEFGDPHDSRYHPLTAPKLTGMGNLMKDQSVTGNPTSFTSGAIQALLYL